MDTGFAGRLAEPFLLAILRNGPNHGYGLLQELEIAFGPGTLAKARVYQLLRRLEEDGLVAPIEGSGNRKQYRLTEEGEAALDEMGSRPPEFFNLLRALFPGMGAPATDQAAGPEEIPRDGARPQSSCPGCDALQVSMERTLPQAALTIKVLRDGPQRLHIESCVVGLALRRLAASMLP